MSSRLWVKICGLTQPDQAVEIAHLGASAIGFICVPASPRYVSPAQIQAISQALIAASLPSVERVGVFANAEMSAIAQTIETGRLTTLQLHGQETPNDCADIRTAFPDQKIIKALRIRSGADLTEVIAYEAVIDRLLLDAYHPHRLGGTGTTLDWQALQTLRSPKPWILAGGLNADNVQTALSKLTPYGIDLSSGVEINPGNKSLAQVRRLFQVLKDEPLSENPQ